MKKAILKTLYLKAKYKKNKYNRMTKERDDALLVVIGYENGERELKLIKKPKYTYYVTKEPQEYHKLSIDKSEVEKRTCYYSNRYGDMAKTIGLYSEYVKACGDRETKQHWIQKNIINNPNLYSVDQNIEDQIKWKFNQKYGDNVADIKLRLGFTDIEVRADINPDINVQMSGIIPISSICHLDSTTNTVHGIFHLAPDLPGLARLKDNLKEFVEKTLKPHLKEERESSIEVVRSVEGDINSVHPYDFNFKFHFTKTEKDLLVTYFDLLNKTKPDFISIWNSNYDMSVIKNRCETLGINIADISSDPSIPPEYRFFQYKVDNERFNKNTNTHYSRFFDKCFTTNYYTIYDHESIFSNLRKRHLEINYKLENISNKYGYIRKFNLKELGLSIIDVILKDPERFVLYAFMDVISTFMIEYNCGDMDRYVINCKDVRFDQGIRKTNPIKFDLATNLMKSNKIIGNNVKYDVVEFTPGAIVASADNIVKKGIKVFGVETFIFRNVIDIDLTSSYPQTIRAFNIVKTATYGRLINIYTNEEAGDIKFKKTISDGMVFNKMLETIDTSIFDMGEKYFNLPPIEDILHLIENSK